jgi:hypothetical protein
MHEIFKEIDSKNDQILRRADFINRLRTDEKIIEFIDREAVQLPYSSLTLTLDEVLIEIEKDETYEQIQMGKQENQINHKEFFTWPEFLSYF